MYIWLQMSLSVSTSNAQKPSATEEQPSSGIPFWIGNKLIEPRLNQITSENRVTHVEHQAMQVLLLLATHPNQAVSRQEILETVWVKTTPNDEGLTQAICKLRTALGDNPKEAIFIQTIRKVGYRLIAPVSFASAPLSKATKHLGPIPKRSIRIQVHGYWIVAAALLFLTLFVISLF